MNSALLVVDVQEGVAADGPQDLEAVTGRIADLMARFRQEGRPVIVVEHHGEGKTLPAVAAASGELVVPKKFNSAFKDTDLEKTLRGLGVEIVVVTGMQTDYCIDATVKSAFERGFSVIVPDGTTTTCDSPLLTATQLRAHYRAMWLGRYAECVGPESVLR